MAQAITPKAPKASLLSECQDGWIGRVIDDRYRVEESIGRGGMGSIYKVSHTRIGKIAAMKLLHGNLATEAELTDRFQREAEAISRLNHPNIVQVFDFGQVDNTLYLVMEYLGGEDLAHILKRDGPIDFGRCSPILIQVCDALTEAHEAGIVHRDLKPENVRVSRTRDGRDFVKVMDFGLAKMLLDEDQKSPGITAKGNLVGTPYYMAPELIRARPVDGRSDIYSLGAMIYRMITGENAYVASTPVGVLTKHVTEELIPPSDRTPELKIPAEVDAIVLKAMAKDPAFRYQSAAEMRKAIITLLGGVTPELSAPLTWSSSSLPAGDLRRASDGASAPFEALSSPSFTTSPDDSALSKEDLSFEKQLRRNRFLLPTLLLALLLIAAGAAVYWFAFRQREVIIPSKELEPNNSPDRATAMARGKVVSGYLGKRVSSTESDRDWYRFRVKGRGTQTLRIRLSRIPNMDHCIELYDASAKPRKLVQADSGALGSAELLPNWPLQPGDYFLLVREVWDVEQRPTENVTDPYRLVASWEPHTSEWELEPNDGNRQETPLRPGKPIRGYLGAYDDRDRYKLVAVKDGILRGEISAIKGINVRILVEVGGRTHRINRKGRSKGEAFKGIKVKAGQEAVITIRRGSEKKSTLSQLPPGVDQPYTLSVDLE